MLLLFQFVKETVAYALNGHMWSKDQSAPLAALAQNEPCCHKVM